MNGGSFFRPGVSLGILVLLIVGSATALGGLAPVRFASTVPMNATASIYVAATGDYGYTPDTFEYVPTNATITVTFVDNSSMAGGHTFTIIGEEGVQLPNTTSQAEIDSLAWGNSPPPLINLNVTAEGDRNISTFRSPGPGWYEFVCAMPSHFQLGMYGFIAFGEKLPSNLTLPSRVGLGSSSLSFNPIIAGFIVALVAIVIAFLLVRRRNRRRATDYASRGPRGDASFGPSDGPERSSRRDEPDD